MGGTDDRRATTSPGSDGTPAVTRREIHGGPGSGDARAGRRTGWRRWGVMGLLAVLVVTVGGVSLAAWRINANVTKVDVSGAIGTDRPSQAGSSAVNILLVGSDSREGAGNDTYGEVAEDPGNHSDTNLILHLSADRSRATVVSIPRDSMTPAPPDCSPTAPVAEWTTRQWNKNYSIGGAGCLIRTIEGNTGLFIDHYAVVDFRGFKSMVDALGGVRVCTPVAIDDEKARLTLAAGEHDLDGEQALAYVRTRKSLGDGSDLGRIERQQAFLSSVAQEATSSKMLFQPTKLFRFLDAATKSLTTDPGFGLGTMEDLASSVRGIGLDRVEFVTVPNEAYEPDPNRVQWTASAEQIWSALREDRALNEPDAAGSEAPTPSQPPLTVAPDEIAVRVVNASGATGLAGQAGEALTVQGFPGVTMANAETVERGTVVTYSAGHEEAARTVAAAFPGATLEEAKGLGSLVSVTLGTRSAPVVELPNRLGTTPLPIPSITPSPAPVETIETRAADADICA